MLLLHERLINQPVLSLRTGGKIATTAELIINPDNLKVVGIYCIDHFTKEPLILLTQDIREMLAKGIVVNDHEVLTDPDELIRMKRILELEYEVTGKQVRTDKNKKIGKVTDFAMDNISFYIQKLYVGQSVIRNLGGTLSVDRSQVIEVTDKAIIVMDPQKPVRDAVPDAMPAG